jgi:hypothetical protein
MPDIAATEDDESGFYLLFFSVMNFISLASLCRICADCSAEWSDYRACVGSLWALMTENSVYL